MDPITRRLVETVHQITENTAPKHNPLVHAAAQFLHKQLGPLTWEKDKSGKSTTDHPSHYYAEIHKGLKDPSTTDINAIMDAAYQHVIGGHHNMGDWSYENLPPEDTMNYDDVDTIHEKGEEEMLERLADHLYNEKKNR